MFDRGKGSSAGALAARSLGVPFLQRRGLRAYASVFDATK